MRWCVLNVHLHCVCGCGPWDARPSWGPPGAVGSRLHAVLCTVLFSSCDREQILMSTLTRERVRIRQQSQRCTIRMDKTSENFWKKDKTLGWLKLRPNKYVFRERLDNLGQDRVQPGVERTKTQLTQTLKIPTKWDTPKSQVGRARAKHWPLDLRGLQGNISREYFPQQPPKLHA